MPRHSLAICPIRPRDQLPSRRRYGTAISSLQSSGMMVRISTNTPVRTDGVAVVNNEHLTEALRRLRKTSSDNNVDRYVVLSSVRSMLISVAWSTIYYLLSYQHREPTRSDSRCCPFYRPSCLGTTASEKRPDCKKWARAKHPQCVAREVQKTSKGQPRKRRP